MSEQPLEMLPSQVEYMLAMAIGKKLIDRFSPAHGDRSNWLSAAVLNFAFMMKPGDETGERYLSENLSTILQEMQGISQDVQLNDAFSLLYSFMLIRIGPTDFERSHGLTLRASELSIALRTPEEICGPVDSRRFLDYVQAYTTRLWNS